jgi:hypothetical protein
LLIILDVAAREYHTAFSLKGVPVVKKFVDRPTEMVKLEKVLLPNTQDHRRRIFVLRGLGGIGKTQLAVEFARQYHRKFSAVFWLDGSSEDSLRQSIARCASALPEDQVSTASRAFAVGGSGNIEEVVREVLDWFAQPDNNRWLLVYDNIDREYAANSSDLDAYDAKRYFPSTDHGSILITTRLVRLEQLGESLRVEKVDRKTAQAIFESWYKRSYGRVNPRLLSSVVGKRKANRKSVRYDRG